MTETTLDTFRLREIRCQLHAWRPLLRDGQMAPDQTHCPQCVTDRSRREATEERAGGALATREGGLSDPPSDTGAASLDDLIGRNAERRHQEEAAARRMDAARDREDEALGLAGTNDGAGVPNRWITDEDDREPAGGAARRRAQRRREAYFAREGRGSYLS